MFLGWMTRLNILVGQLQIAKQDFKTGSSNGFLGWTYAEDFNINSDRVTKKTKDVRQLF